MGGSDFHSSPLRSLLAASEEDRFTEYLAQLLDNQLLLTAFLAERCELRLPDGEFASLSVDIQVRIEGGRPDLVIGGDETLLIFEAKVGSWIHGDQIEEYARHLRSWQADNPDGTGKLYLIAPKTQLAALLLQGNTDADPTQVSGISWEEIAETVAQTAQKVTSERTRVHMIDYADLISYRLGEVGRPFTLEEVTVLGDRQFAMSLNRVYSLIPVIITRLKKETGKELKTKKSNGAGFTGYQINVRGSKFWLGVWMHPWSEIGGSPLCL